MSIYENIFIISDIYLNNIFLFDISAAKPEQ